MRINITCKGIELTEAIKNYVEVKINGLDRFCREILRADVIVGIDSRHHLKGQIFLAECKLFMPGKEIFASKKEKTLYKAIDKIRDYLEIELKKYKAKIYSSDDKKAIHTKRAAKEYQVEM